MSERNKKRIRNRVILWQYGTEICLRQKRKEERKYNKKVQERSNIVKMNENKRRESAREIAQIGSCGIVTRRRVVTP